MQWKCGDRMSLRWALLSNLGDLKSIHQFNHKFGFYYSIRFFTFFFCFTFLRCRIQFSLHQDKAPFSIDALLKFWKRLLIIPPELRCKFNTEITDTYATANYMVQNRDWRGNLWAQRKVIWIFNRSGANFEFHIDKDNDNHELLI